MSELTTLDIAAARDALAKGEFTSEELTAAYLEAIDAAKVLNAYITVLPGKAIEMAKESDARRKAVDHQLTGLAGLVGGQVAGHHRLHVQLGKEALAEAVQ